MDNSTREHSWSLSEINDLLAFLGPGEGHPTQPTSETSAQVGDAINRHGAGCPELKRVEQITRRVVDLGSIGPSEPFPPVFRGRKVIAKNLQRTSASPAKPRPTRQGHLLPLEIPLPFRYPTLRFPSGRKRPRPSEDRRTSRGPCVPPLPKSSLFPNPSPRVSVAPPHCSSPSGSTKVEKSEDRRTTRPKPCRKPTSHPPGVDLAGQSEDRRTILPGPLLLHRPAPSKSPPSDSQPREVEATEKSEDRRTTQSSLLLPCLPSSPSSPHTKEACAPGSVAGTVPATPGDKKRYRATRRAGRKNQLRRLWTEYHGRAFPYQELASPISGNQDQPPAPPIPKRTLRIIEDVPYIGPRIIRWHLIPLDLDPVVYPATVPLHDPRRQRYIQLRSETLYPRPR